VASVIFVTSGSDQDFHFALTQAFPSPLVWGFAYFLGGIPALLAGVAVCFIVRRLSGWRYWGAVGLAGLLGAIIGMSWDILSTGPQPSSLLSFSALVGATGLVSALACAGLTEFVLRLRRPA
jgi:hypothetical protein